MDKMKKKYTIYMRDKTDNKQEFQQEDWKGNGEYYEL